jgi:hypothetical protein
MATGADTHEQCFALTGFLAINLSKDFFGPLRRRQSIEGGFNFQEIQWEFGGIEKTLLRGSGF